MHSDLKQRHIFNVLPIPGQNTFWDISQDMNQKIPFSLIFIFKN